MATKGYSSIRKESAMSARQMSMELADSFSQIQGDVSRRISGIKATPGRVKQSAVDTRSSISNAVDNFSTKTTNAVNNVRAFPGRVESAYTATKVSIEAIPGKVQRNIDFLNKVAEDTGRF